MMKQTLEQFLATVNEQSTGNRAEQMRHLKADAIARINAIDDTSDISISLIIVAGETDEKGEREMQGVFAGKPVLMIEGMLKGVEQLLAMIEPGE